MTKRIRFWHYCHNGEAVKIKITAGETLRHSSGWPTDEGWSRESTEWDFDGHMLVCRWETDGVDCDGRLSRWGVSYCVAHELHAGHRDEDGIAFPAWKQGRVSQRDYSAEAMGY